MIYLDVEGYCQNCTEFEADVKKCIAGTAYDDPLIDIRVVCKNRNCCKTIYKYLKVETKEKEK